MDRKSREIGSFLGEKAYLREIFIRNNPKIQKIYNRKNPYWQP